MISLLRPCDSSVSRRIGGGTLNILLGFPLAPLLLLNPLLNGVVFLLGSSFP
jgi:hypothetical protein